MTKKQKASLSRSGSRKASSKKTSAKPSARSKAAASRSRPAARIPKRPRTPTLPGLEDSAIKPLEDVAAAYADIRDQRIALNQEEASLKQTAIKLMQRYQKTIYRRDGITIQLVEGDLDVKVKIKKGVDGDGLPAAGAEFAGEAGGAEVDGDAMQD